jgi:hypothetical protein
MMNTMNLGIAKMTSNIVNVCVHFLVMTSNSKSLPSANESAANYSISKDSTLEVEKSLGGVIGNLGPATTSN